MLRIRVTSSARAGASGAGIRPLRVSGETDPSARYARAAVAGGPVESPGRRRRRRALRGGHPRNGGDGLFRGGRSPRPKGVDVLLRFGHWAMNPSVAAPGTRGRIAGADSSHWHYRRIFRGDLPETGPWGAGKKKRRQARRPASRETHVFGRSRIRRNRPRGYRRCGRRTRRSCSSPGGCGDRGADWACSPGRTPDRGCRG